MLALVSPLWQKFKEIQAVHRGKKLCEHAWMVAPLAYQKGPLTPYSQATLELCKIVAAHVHCTSSP